jgi:hypothetical protein
VEFRKAIDLNPSWIWGNIKLGMAYSRMGAHDEAMACVRRADELIGELPELPSAKPGSPRSSWRPGTRRVHETHSRDSSNSRGRDMSIRW